MRSSDTPVITRSVFDLARRVGYPGAVSDSQTWTILILLAGTLLGLFAEMRAERKEVRHGFEGIRAELGAFRLELNGLRGDLSELKVTVARIDERLKGLEAR